MLAPNKPKEHAALRANEDEEMLSAEEVVAELLKIQGQIVANNPISDDVANRRIQALGQVIRLLSQPSCGECGGELQLLCAMCQHGGFERIAEKHMDGQLWELAGAQDPIYNPPQVGRWNGRVSRWEVKRHESSGGAILYGQWVFTHARPLTNPESYS